MQRLSRGLVLVKWWLLAIPHHLVVALFTDGWFGWSILSLIGVLVVVAVVMLAFTGRYPQPLFDFLMGMNRWWFRVLGYIMLMRDEYRRSVSTAGAPIRAACPSPRRPKVPASSPRPRPQRPADTRR